MYRTYFIILYNDQQIFHKLSHYYMFRHLCHPQTAYNQYLAKLHKYFKYSCW